MLSAALGLVDATHSIDDYDQRMDAARARELAASPAQRQAFALAAQGHDEVVVYGGALYRGVIRQWAEALGLELSELVGANRGCGDHFSALQEHVASLR